MHIDNVIIDTPHFNAQHDFYTQTIGFPLVSADDNRFTVQLGASTLTLRRSTAPNIHHIAMNIPRNQFDDALAWTAERVPLLPYNGKPFIDFSTSTWQAKSLYFEDIAGNVLEFIARHRLPAPDAPAAFSAHSIQAISEIGMATDDVPKLVAGLQHVLHAPIFDGDPDTGFCALGDDNGLLVCVTTGRNWLPTDNRPSGVHPLGITVRGDAFAQFSFEGGLYRVALAPGD